MKTHKLWIIFLIIYMKGSLATLASSTGSLTTLAPSTGSPTTLAPSTGSPTTLAPSTGSPTTLAPSTGSPTTLALSTEPPTTLGPSTDPPTTLAPITDPLTTVDLSTEPPTTLAPSTDPPTTLAPSCDPGAENCDCDYQAKQCICNQLCGIIYAPDNGTKTEPVSLKYTLTGDPSMLTVLRMNSSTCNGLTGTSCNIELPDGQVIKSCRTLEEFYLTSSFIVNKQKDKCDWNMIYIKYPFENKVTNLTEMSDVIYNPFIADPYGDFSGLSHRPNTQAHYILQTPESGYIINVNVSNQKLGVPFDGIHDAKATKSSTTGDIVLVGSGSSVLSGDETVLYGSKFMETTRMRIDADVAHVSFSYSSGEKDVDLQFNYTFIRKEVITTTVPPTVITTPMPPSENYFTFAAINCIAPKIDVALSLEPAVKIKLAHIATKYGADDPSLHLDHNITNDEVGIYDVKRCNPVKCDPEYCVAYNFSILYRNETGNWIFTKEIMDEMLLKYSGEFVDLTPDRICDAQVCDETRGISMVPYILVSVVVVVIGCIISLIVYKAGLGSVAREHKSKYKQENQERMEDERRRSSGNIFMLGLGNTRGSLTSVSSSRKFSMPFPTKDKKSRNNVKYDVSGFKEFNPENSFGGEPVILGLEKEFLGNPSTMRTYYSNDGYVSDEVSGPSRVQQQHWDNPEGSSSGSSSDVEDDGISVPLPPLSQSHELARRQLQERLATIPASDSESDNESDQDVLFNRNPGNVVQLKPSVVPVDVHPYPEHETETIL